MKINSYHSWATQLKCLLLLCFMALGGLARAQSAAQQISGKVTDEAGAALPGVTVLIKGSTAAVVTDDAGSYRIRVNSAQDVLRFAMVGKVSRELSVGGRSVINVTLKDESNTLQDLVVVGYGTSNRKNLTGAITSVKPDQFNAGVISTPSQLLQGKVAGLNITKSGNPNENGAIILRGPSSLRAGAQEPLYVIDGVAAASIDLVAPDDIKAIDVLKDASATAIYGARAANGVILITTKRGDGVAPGLSYSSYAGTESVSNTIDMLSAEQLRNYLGENKKSLNPTDDDGSATNWQDVVQRRGFSTNHNLSLYGGSSKTSYGISANFLENNGIMKGSALERYTLKANVGQKAFNDRLNLNFSVFNSRTVRDDISPLVYPNMLIYLPTVAPRRQDGSYTEDFSRTRNYLNPLSLIDNNIINNKIKTFLGNFQAELDIVKGLKYTLSLSYQDENTNGNFYNNRQSGINRGLNGVAVRNAYANTKKLAETYLSYDKAFGKHVFKLLGGYSFQEDRNGDGFQSSNQGFVTDELTYNNLGLGDPLPGSVVNYGTVRIQTLRLISFYGRINYDLDNKYLFQASLRRDGSSAFGLNNRWGYFPSASAAWRISEENFMKNAAFVEDLKVRVGYGVTGNSLGFDAFTRFSLYAPVERFYYDGRYINAVGPFQNENPDLKWERTAMTNVGVDFSLFKGRVQGSFDVYNKKTSDLIWDYRVSTTQYFVGNLTANVGQIDNKGFEAVVDVSVFNNKKFTWKSSVNFSHNKNVVRSLSNEKFSLSAIPTAQLGGKGQTSNYSQVIQEGLPIGSFNTYRYAGKDSKGVSQFYLPDGNLTTEYSKAAVGLTGNAQPDLIYGWNNSFTLGRFDLNVFLRGVYGNQILNATLAGLNSPGDATTNNIPQFTLNESVNDNNSYIISDRFIENGSYLRLDNATLGYSFNLEKLKALKRLRVYTTASNLFVITKYRGIDPEINMGGIQPGIDNNNFYPKTRSFLFGLNVTF
ncbi:SusC/RagA family TonB-linked outer membrane protein [Pedobacter yulinensis]|uniref:SusC/RagA family TonB-linked outer membrane protein n=1 Tax=Pedobacter yulinensis TaxID=2126353 RepID=A0A2T3HJI3_9SPHI|nr:SusC/RagA family TonB-linked outer membrane protein [Pedobacter yulinensis]PST82597.1 SusC/RagA family TonB-linked outer membrane protein [Pedobacter yulinensis]